MRRHWDPPRWLVLFGYGWAIAWGYSAPLPKRTHEPANPLARYLEIDLDSILDTGLARLLAEEQ